MNLLFSLLQTMAVFLVVAYIYSKSPWFRPLANENLSVRDKVYLYFFFSAISIMGTYLGLPIRDALANTRAIGPVLAGIIGGPVLGTAVGFTGGLHRYFFGGSLHFRADFPPLRKDLSAASCIFVCLSTTGWIKRFARWLRLLPRYSLKRSRC